MIALLIAVLTFIIAVIFPIAQVTAAPAAQTESTTTPILPNTTLDLRLDGEGAAELIYEAEGGETITVTVRAADPETMDTVLEILGLDDRRLAYNDDHDTENADLAPTDSVILRLTLPQPGSYPIRVDSFNGVTAGEVAVTLEVVEPVGAEMVITGIGVVGLAVDLPPDSVYRYPLTVEAETACTITARDPGGRLDPVLVLLDPAGAIAAANDDHEADDLRLNVFDAQITFEALPPGDYLLTLREFLGRAGALSMTIDCAG